MLSSYKTLGYFSLLPENSNIRKRYFRDHILIMYGQRLSHYVALLLLKITYFHVSAKENYLISEGFMLEDIPVLPLIFAKSEYLPDGSCKDDMRSFLHGLFNASVWAIQSKFMKINSIIHIFLTG